MPCKNLPASRELESLENKLYDLQLRLFYQWGIQICNILCFTESWLNDDTDNIDLAGFSGQSSYVSQGRGCVFVNNTGCVFVNNTGCVFVNNTGCVFVNNTGCVFVNV